MRLQNVLDLINDADIMIENLDAKSDYEILKIYAYNEIPRELRYKEVVNICCDRQNRMVCITIH